MNKQLSSGSRCIILVVSFHLTPYFLYVSIYSEASGESVVFTGGMSISHILGISSGSSLFVKVRI